MIVREIRERPEEVLANFDWFNDFADTKRWALVAYPKIVPRLNAGYEQWVKERQEAWRADQTKLFK